MDSFNDFFQKTVYFGAGLAAYMVETVEHLDENFASLQVEVQQTIDDLIERGEQVVSQTTQPSDRVSAQVAPLHRRLVLLLNGNEALARHLIEQACEQHPERALVWVYEKVIYDLERDRGL